MDLAGHPNNDPLGTDMASMQHKISGLTVVDNHHIDNQGEEVLGFHLGQEWNDNPHVMTVRTAASWKNKVVDTHKDGMTESALNDLLRRFVCVLTLALDRGLGIDRLVEATLEVTPPKMTPA